ncbi:hypothetical protein FH972_001438 [Carpinus fangiana]|uniref:Legume lectin domain-containing protein n=1 Tax=Carpinus fangiana TaxID=176857 RepID=A0A5N6QC35_9ROSI|nr:hypothetical protein FH972_001438 [Carpinus fangiana]
MAEKLFSLWVFLLLLHPVKPDVAPPLLDGFSGGFSAAGDNLTLDGIAAVDSNGVLQLTNYTSNVAHGHAFYSNPIQFKNSSGEVMSFSTSFAFAIIPQPGKQVGDGLAFAISPAKGIPEGKPGSYIGLFNTRNNGNFLNHILAVEFDTYMNAEHGETDNNHVAVDINSIISNKSVPVPFNLTSGQLTTYTSTMAPGHAFYSNPIQFKNSSGEVMSFSTSFAFAITPQPGKQGGDGLAFAISPAKGILGGNPGSYIGLFNASNNGNLSNHILAVEFDTYMNAEYGETDNNHVAVDINSIISNKSVPVPFNLTSASSEEMMLVDWVWEKWAVGAVLDVVDPRMVGKFDEAEAILVLKLGLICSNDDADVRPTMRLVVRYLEGELALQEEVAMPYKKKGGGRSTVEFEDYTQSFPTTSSVYDVGGR